MITEKDLREAIAECQGVRNPDANTCIKLAAFYTILDNLYEKEQTTPQYSFASTPDVQIPYSGSQFSEYVTVKGIEKVYPIVDELIETLSVINPKLYQSVMRKIADI